MWFVAGFLLYFGIAKKKEPLLLVPISFGILLANLPLGEVIKPAGKEGDPMGFLLFFQVLEQLNQLESRVYESCHSKS